MAVSLCCLALSEFQQARHVILLTSHETAAFYKFLQIIIHFKHFFSHISHNIQTPPSAEAVNTFLKSRYQKINLSRDSEGDQCPLSGTHHSSLDVSGQERDESLLFSHGHSCGIYITVRDRYRIRRTSPSCANGTLLQTVSCFKRL